MKRIIIALIVLIAINVQAQTPLYWMDDSNIPAKIRPISNSNPLPVTLANQLDTNRLPFLNKDNTFTGTNYFRKLISDTTITKGIVISEQFDLYTVKPPTTLGLELMQGSSDLPNGKHWYAVTYLTEVGETGWNLDTTFSITTTDGYQKVKLTLPISNDKRVIGRKIYRSYVNDIEPIEYRFYFLQTINDNTTQIFIDDISDDDLGDNLNIFGTKLSNGITINGVPFINNFGGNTLNGINSGHSLTTGGGNVINGCQAGYSLTTGYGNVINGYQAGYSLTTGGGNVINGYGSGYLLTTGERNVFMGMFSGYYETNCNDRLFIDNRTRANKTDAYNKALIWGNFADNTNNQTLTINGKVGILNANPNYTLDVNGTVNATALKVNSVPVYTNNEAAIAGGLTGGQIYKTSTGQLMIVY